MTKEEKEVLKELKRKERKTLKELKRKKADLHITDWELRRLYDLNKIEDKELTFSDFKKSSKQTYLNYLWFINYWGIYKNYNYSQFVNHIVNNIIYYSFKPKK